MLGNILRCVWCLYDPVDNCFDFKVYLLFLISGYVIIITRCTVEKIIFFADLKKRKEFFL